MEATREREQEERERGEEVGGFSAQHSWLPRPGSARPLSPPTPSPPPLPPPMPPTARCAPAPRSLAARASSSRTPARPAGSPLRVCATAKPTR